MPGAHQGMTVSEGLRSADVRRKGTRTEGWGGGGGGPQMDMHMPGNMQGGGEIKETPHHSAPGEK